MNSITVVVPSLCLGGAEKVSVNLANELVRTSWNRSVVFKIWGEFHSELSEKVNIISFQSAKTLRSVMPMLMYFWNKPQCVITTLRSSSKLLGLLVKLPFFKNTTFIIREAGLYSEGRASVIGSKLRRILLRFLYRSADAFIFNSQGTLESFRQAGIISHDSITTVIGNPVIPANFQDISNMSVSHPWLVNKKGPLIITAGRLHPIKDHKTLIRAFALVVSKRPDARLILLVKVDKEPPLKNLSVS